MEETGILTPLYQAFWRERLAKELEDREEGFVEDGKLVKGAQVRPFLREAKYGYN